MPRLIARFNSDGSIVRRTRAETWVLALADASGMDRGPAPFLSRGMVTQLAWARTGHALKAAMNKRRG